MGKLYVFAIGGTGSRVLKSLTMLLSAGVKTGVTEIVPITIDPDANCGDKTDTVLLMNQYSALYDTLSHHAGRKIDAFSTKLTKLNFPNDYIMPMGENTNTLFGQYMHFASLSDENKALVNMLFSDANQNADMTIGFTGNPNIGSVVLNQFAASPQFVEFAASFTPGDKIMIISSIFGGSGASGFPLLLKNLRHVNPHLHIPAAAAIQSAEIGAVTVLPYFNVSPEEEAKVDSDTFISKTKSALSYYERNLTGIDALYYIGDDARGQQEYNDGGPGQRNKAHFVELAAALAIVDFSNNAFLAGGAATVYKEFGINQDTPAITLGDLDFTTKAQIARPLTEFTLYSKYLHEKLQSSLSQTWVAPYLERVVGGQTYQQLQQFTHAFLSWEKSMEDDSHARKFTPFVLEPRPNDVFGLAKGVTTSKVPFVSASNWDLVDHFLNKDGCSKDANQEGLTEGGKFIAHGLSGIKKVVSKKINL